MLCFGSVLIVVVVVGVLSSSVAGATAAFAGASSAALPLSSAPFPYELVRGSSYNVSYDSRAILINGERVLLQSGSLHYPRASTAEYTRILAKFKANLLNTVQIYIFWNLHEPQEGQYDFSSELHNFTALLQAAQQVGLFVNLRIGPYVCAEWDYGGIPYWMKEKDGVVFRTDNDAWKTAMANFLTVVIKRAEPWFARNGGPVILAQVENEYGNLEGYYGAAGHAYMLWAANLAVAVEPSLVWIMCVQDDAPASVVQTCNGFYCDQWIAGHVQRQPQQPHMFTELWSGWFQDWGEAKAYRPPEDLAFSVVRWVMLGGGFHNYYMFYGGTNFGRSSGGPFVTTSYDYAAPLNEYGGENEPTYSHLKQMHSVLQTYAATIVGTDSIPPPVSLGPNQEGNSYGTIGMQGSLAFLANIDSDNTYTVTFAGHQFDLPPWSVSIVDGATFAIVFNTAQIGGVSAAILPMASAAVAESSIEILAERQSRSWSDAASLSFAHPLQFSPQISTIPESIGSSLVGPEASTTPLELLSVTKDLTDYLWYTLSITLSSAQIAKGNVTLNVSNLNDYFYAFIDGYQLASGRSIASETSFSLNVSYFSPGTHQLSLLTLSNGLANSGYTMETYKTGLQGEVKLDAQSLSPSPPGVPWLHYPYLNGELLQYGLPSTAAPWNVSFASAVGKPMTWWRVVLAAPPAAANGHALDLSSMSKGFAYVNGHHIGRYWLVRATLSNCPPTPCSYAGSYDPGRCRRGCGDYSQQYYRVPDSWIEESGGQVTVILFEEVGGDPSKIQWTAF